MEPKGEDVQAKTHGFWYGVREWIRVIVIAFIIALPIRFFIAEPYIVQGASMDPTFSTGQFLIVDRLTYRFEQPSRGDVIVFEYPNDPSSYYIKRIIGLPGESISIKNGKAVVTTASSTEQIVLEEPYIGPSHVSKDNLPARALGADEYFVMGDNRAQSSDSRVWGSLDRKFIIGRPILRLSPVTDISFLPGKYHE